MATNKTKRTKKTAPRKTGAALSPSQRKLNEKIRIAKITATWAKKNYLKNLDIKKPTNKDKAKRRQLYNALLKKNSKVIDLVKKKPTFKKLTAKRGWETQNFGLPQRFEINFTQWFNRFGKSFSSVNDYKLPKDAALLLLFVSDSALNSSAYMELELKYTYDENTGKNIGFLYTIETNED